MKVAFVQQLYNSCFPFLLEMKPNVRAYLGLTFFFSPQAKIEQLFSWKIHRSSCQLVNKTHAHTHILMSSLYKISIIKN